MVLWQEEAYTRTDEHGQPVSFVGSTWAMFPSHWLTRYMSSDENAMAVDSSSWPGAIYNYTLSLGTLHPSYQVFISTHVLDSVGFFLDSYDLFIINLVTPIWTYEYATFLRVEDLKIKSLWMTNHV